MTKSTTLSAQYNTEGNRRSTMTTTMMESKNYAARSKGGKSRGEGGGGGGDGLLQEDGPLADNVVVLDLAKLEFARVHTLPLFLFGSSEANTKANT
jgi:hypothetical protein